MYIRLKQNLINTKMTAYTFFGLLLEESEK